jgi:GT2 family glycosyltransferase
MSKGPGATRALNGHQTTILARAEREDRPGVVRHWSTGAAVSGGAGHRPGISLVLCTYQRSDSVARFLASVSPQTRPVDEVLVIDASRDGKTEAVVAEWQGGPRLSYWRVEEPLRGLTRQRNFGLESVAYDLVAFFDDDVVLDPECLAEMERPHRTLPHVAGVGCFAETWMAPTLLWRARRLLRIVPDLRPGSYTRTGMSVPWRFHAPTTDVIEGDWLPGCAMMLKTKVAAQVGFDEGLAGYGQGEDLDFSLRLRRRGRLAVAGAARCEHFHAPAGRPDAYKLGQMEIWNRYRIWRRVHQTPRLVDHFAFAYAWTLDTIFLMRDAVRPRYAANGLRRIAGRVRGASRVLTEWLPR